MNKYNLAQILAAWEASYDEDMKKEYPGFIQELKRSEASPTIPKSMFWKGKAKDFPGVQEVIKQNGSK